MSRFIISKANEREIAGVGENVELRLQADQ